MQQDKVTQIEKMPVFFIGHGSPMNAITDSAFARHLAAMGESLKRRPKAILVVSAHWQTQGSFVSAASKPEIIYDFSGFPAALSQVVYPAPGSPEFAEELRRLAPEVREDVAWGLDHAAWAVLKHMFPLANVPVFELSLDYRATLQQHFDLGSKIAMLREEGVLVVCSGNVVHNIRLWHKRQGLGPYGWDVEFDGWVKGKLDQRDFAGLIDYESQGKAAKLAVPTLDHYIPLLYCVGMATPDEELQHVYEEVLPAMSMRCVKIG